MAQADRLEYLKSLLAESEERRAGETRERAQAQEALLGQLKALTAGERVQLLEIMGHDRDGAELLRRKLEGVTEPADDPELTALIGQIRKAVELSTDVAATMKGDMQRHGARPQRVLSDGGDTEMDDQSDARV